MGLTSWYVFDHTDLRGNFTFTNVPTFGPTFYEDETNLGSTSTLFVSREDREISIDLYDLFNSGNFLSLIDIKPLINGVSSDNNEDALMVLISNGMKHYGYRNSDIRSGWMQWRYIPYHDKQPGRHQESDLLNQIAFDIHVDRGVGTVDNDGWVGFYYFFFFDGAGRLGAFVDGWAFHCGGGGGLYDDGPGGLGEILNMVLPQFLAPIQSFLDSLCATAGLRAPGQRDSGGRALFDRFYLLPGNGSTSV